MKKYFILLFFICASLVATAQTKGLKIAYIDMDYILDKVPDFAEAKSQLEQRASKWKGEMDAMRNDITRLKDALKAEKALLTKELIEEREEEIQQLEKELTDYQEKKFGPKGDLITQKTVLVKPIQDQVFTVVQDVAATRRYDFVFDRSSDLTMLFAAKKYDISDLIVKRLSRSAKQEKMNSKQAKQLDEQERKEELESDPDYADRLKAQEDKKAARQKLLDERKAAAQARRDEALAKKEAALKERQEAREAAQAKAAGKTATAKKAEDDGVSGPEDDAPSAQQSAADVNAEKRTEAADKAADAKAAREAAQQEAKDERDRKIKERQEALEKRRQEMQAKREAAIKEREEKKQQQQQQKEAPADSPGAPAEGED